MCWGVLGPGFYPISIHTSLRTFVQIFVQFGSQFLFFDVALVLFFGVFAFFVNLCFSRGKGGILPHTIRFLQRFLPYRTRNTAKMDWYDFQHNRPYRFCFCLCVFFFLVWGVLEKFHTSYTHIFSVFVYLVLAQYLSLC